MCIIIMRLLWIFNEPQMFTLDLHLLSLIYLDQQSMIYSVVGIIFTIGFRLPIHNRVITYARKKFIYFATFIACKAENVTSRPQYPVDERMYRGKIGSKNFLLCVHLTVYCIEFQTALILSDRLRFHNLLSCVFYL